MKKKKIVMCLTTANFFLIGFLASVSFGLDSEYINCTNELEACFYKDNQELQLDYSDWLSMPNEFNDCFVR